MTGKAFVIIVPLQSPTTSTGSCSSFSHWRSDPEQAQAQKQEGGRTSLPKLRAAVLKTPILMLPLPGCNQHALCPFSSSWISRSLTSGEVLSGSQGTFRWSPWIPIRQGSPGHTEVLLQIFRQILNPDTLRVRLQLIYITVLACRT